MGDIQMGRIVDRPQDYCLGRRWLATAASGFPDVSSAGCGAWSRPLSALAHLTLEKP